MTEYLGPTPPFWSTSRIVSGAIAGTYGMLGYIAGGTGDAVGGLMYCVIPVACIWFSDNLAGYIGPWGMSFISRESPEIGVAIMGWVLLLLPVLCVPLFWLVTR